MKTCFVVNPRSGGSAGALAPVDAFAKKRGATVRLTTHAGHARELAAEAVATGFELIVAVGGDGTMNEVASSLLGTPAVLGLVSCGSGNGLGRELGLHGSIARSLAILESGRPREIDTGRAGGWPFFNVAGLGFEADLADRYNRLVRRGLPRYAVATLAEWRARRPRDFVVVCDGARHPIRALTLTIANGAQYGNNVRIAPAARIDDGMLDVIALPVLNFFPGVGLSWHLMRGTVDRHPAVRTWRGARLVIESDEPGLLHVDGETHEAGTSVEFEVVPGSLRVIAPG